MLNAIASHIRSYLTKIGQCPFGDAAQTGDGGKVKIENSIAVLKPMRNGSVEVPVDDPLRLFQLSL